MLYEGFERSATQATFSVSLGMRPVVQAPLANDRLKNSWPQTIPLYAFIGGIGGVLGLVAGLFVVLGTGGSKPEPVEIDPAEES